MGKEISCFRNFFTNKIINPWNLTIYSMYNIIVIRIFYMSFFFFFLVQPEIDTVVVLECGIAVM